MSLVVCNRCTTRYARDVGYCPQCTSTDFREDGEDVAKITVHGGASDTDAEPGQAGYQAPAEVQAEPEAAEQPAAEAEDVPTVRELRDRLRERGLSTSGSKDELRDRLAAAEAGEVAEGEED